jgi:glycosyltransferase involved in cell wall biosynthesis
VTVICTVLNEAASVDELLGTLAEQTRQPDEVVVVDGGSSDGTWQVLEHWQARGVPLRCLRVEGANISQGRNEAVRAGRGEIIASTDAGVRLEPTWLAELMAPIERDQEGGADVVSGFFVADARSLFEWALGATTLPLVGEVQAERFLPSSRSVAFRRAAWQAVGGYPEWLDYCEDLVFDLALRRRGYRFSWAPGAIAKFRPRANAWRFAVQYFRYARGDGKALLWTRRHLIRYGTYLGAPALLWSSRGHPLVLALVAVAGMLYCRRPYLRLAASQGRRSAAERVAAVGLIPFLRLVGDLAKMAGYPVGLAWRLRRTMGGACPRFSASATLTVPRPIRDST